MKNKYIISLADKYYEIKDKIKEFEEINYINSLDLNACKHKARSLGKMLKEMDCEIDIDKNIKLNKFQKDYILYVNHYIRKSQKINIREEYKGFQKCKSEISKEDLDAKMELFDNVINKCKNYEKLNSAKEILVLIEIISLKEERFQNNEITKQLKNINDEIEEVNSYKINDLTKSTYVEIMKNFEELKSDVNNIGSLSSGINDYYVKELKYYLDIINEEIKNQPQIDFYNKPDCLE